MNIKQMKVLLEMAKKYNLPDFVIPMTPSALYDFWKVHKEYVAILKIYHPETNEQLVGCGEIIEAETIMSLLDAGVDFVFVEPA